MSSNIYIADIFWHNIYLNITFEGDDLDKYSFYISNLKKEQYKIEVTDGKSIINIVNIEKTKLLRNGKWYFLAEKDGKYELIGITAKCGYKLEQLDKVYRYGREVYAYLVTFSVKDIEEVKDFILKLKEKQIFVQFTDTENKMICVMHTSYMMRNRRNDGRNLFVESGKITTLLRKIFFVILKSMINWAYHMLAFIRKKDGKHILLMSETRTPMGGNLKALDDRLKERKLNHQYKISYSFSKTLQQSKWKTLLTWSRLLWLIAKQDIIFVDDYVPIFKTIHLRKDTRLIQLWHAGVGFKSVGYSRFGRTGSPLPLDSCHRQYTYAVVGGNGLIDVYEEVFGIPKESILPYGLARLDGYLDPEKVDNYRKDFYSRYPELKNKKIILFAPTYRGKTQDEAYYPLEWISSKQIKELCNDEYIFAYKMHPFITDKIDIDEKCRSFIYDFSQEKDINNLFYVTDILITDFSSNIYEFSLQKKPIIFFAPDKDFYQLTRGVHRTLDEAPGVVCESFDEVIKTVNNKEFEIEKIEKFVEESFDDQKKLASDSLIDNLIIKGEK